MMWSLTTALLLFSLQATDYAAEGIKALEAQKYEEAAQSFSKAVDADPKDYSAHFHLALANSLLGRDLEAISGYKKVLELKPGLYQAELNLGIVLIRQKQAAEAIPLLESAIQTKPKEAKPHLYLADAYFASGNFAKAERSYSTAIEIDPKSGAAELGLAHSLLKQDRLKDAEAHFRKAAELDPALKNGLLELASLYEKTNHPQDAIAIYREFPDNVAAKERMGELLIESGKAAEAIPELEAAVRSSPTSANRVALAMAYRKSNDIDRAIEVLAQAVQTDPDNSEVRMIYGRNLRDQKNFSAAAQEFDRVTQAKPDSVEAWNELTGMLISLEKYPQALASMDRIKALGGETPGHLYLRAIVLDKLKDLKGALASYEGFLASSQGKNPDEEFKARQRARIIKKELDKR